MLDSRVTTKAKQELVNKLSLLINDGSLIMYDGQCGFCQTWVQFVLNRDHKNQFYFAPLQFSWSQTLHPQSQQSLETVVLYNSGKIYEKSSAAIRILIRLGGLWNLMGIFLIVPPIIRDFVYGLIARNRHKLMKNSHCELPSATQRSRFLKDNL